MSLTKEADWSIFKGVMLEFLRGAFPEDTKIQWQEDDDDFGSAKIFVKTVAGFYLVRGYLKSEVTALKMGVYAYARSEADRIVNEFKEFVRRQHERYKR